MRKLCPNLDREDGLETVLEVPIPEEMCVSGNHKNATISWHNMKSWMKPSNNDRSQSANAVFGSKNTEVQLLLGVIGAPLIPLPIPNDQQPISHAMKDQPIESSMAKYIMKQYIAAVGGEKALNSVDSMYAIGKVKMAASEFCTGERSLNGGKNKLKVKSLLRSVGGGGEMGGFVLWQKRPELWCLELVVSGCKISAGSDGRVAWRQTPWHHSHASRGPPRPLRRLLQIVATESNREDDEGGLEVLGELIGRVNASTRGQESCDEAVAGPKIIRSLNSEGVKGIVNSSSSGSGQSVLVSEVGFGVGVSGHASISPNWTQILTSDSVRIWLICAAARECISIHNLYLLINQH